MPLTTVKDSRVLRMDSHGCAILWPEALGPGLLRGRLITKRKGHLRRSHVG